MPDFRQLRIRQHALARRLVQQWDARGNIRRDQLAVQAPVQEMPDQGQSPVAGNRPALSFDRVQALHDHAAGQVPDGQVFPVRKEIGLQRCPHGLAAAPLVEMAGLVLVTDGGKRLGLLARIQGTLAGLFDLGINAALNQLEPIPGLVADGRECDFADFC